MYVVYKLSRDQFSTLVVILVCLLFFASLLQVEAQSTELDRNARNEPARLHQADLLFHAGYSAFAKHDLQTARVDFQQVIALVPNMEEGHSALGAVLVQLGQYSKAIPELIRSLVLKPSDRTATMNLAVAYSQTGVYLKAITLFHRLKDEEMNDTAWPPDVLAAYARALAGTQRVSTAILEMQRAVTAMPSNAAMQDELGSLYAQEKNWAQAASAFQEAIRLDRELATAHLHLGVTRLAQGQLPSAIDELTIATKLLPKNAEPLLELGIALLTAGNAQDAIPILRRALELDPNSVEIKYQLALTLQSADQEQQAIPLFQQTVAAQPTNTQAITNLALALVQVGKAKESISLYQRALQLSPDDVTVYQDLAVAYIQESDIDDAIRELRTGLKLSPNDPALHYNLGLAYKLQDNTTAAIVELELCSKLDPALPDPHYTLGILYMQEGHFNRAAVQLRQALQMSPTNANGWAILGSVYQQQNKFPEAIAALREAIRQGPERPSPHITLATILAEQGNHTAAKEERKKAADLMRIAVNQQRATFETNTGDMQRQKGMLSQATQSYQQAIQDDPQYAAAHTGLAKVFEQEGKSAEAAEESRKADVLATPKP